MKTKYYKSRLWKITWSLSWIGVWRLVKFYWRRDAIGAPWRIVRHSAQETRISP